MSKEKSADKPVSNEIESSKSAEGSTEAKTVSGSSEGLLDSLWKSDTSEKVWGFWESVKNNDTVKQATLTLQKTQAQANEAWKGYDADQLKSKLALLGKSATEYIDNADRKLESLEKQSLEFLKKAGSEFVDKAKETTHTVERSGVLLFNGPEKVTTSRLDAELMALSSSPDQIVNLDYKNIDFEGINIEDHSKLLADNSDLNDTFKVLVPTKMGAEEFWKRYTYLKQQLVNQDKRRKQLIESQGSSRNDLDDWGSSDEEETEESATKVGKVETSKESKTPPGSKLDKTAGDAAESQISTKPKRIDEEGSDDDWE